MKTTKIDKFNIHRHDNVAVSIKGYKFNIDDITLVAHKKHGIESFWDVSEYTTGLRFGYICETTRKKAIDKAIEIYNKLGKAIVNEHIEKAAKLN